MTENIKSSMAFVGTSEPVVNALPDDGWWPDEDNAPVCQWFRVRGRSIAQVLCSSGRWRAYSMVELNQSKTTGKPLFASVPTREEAKQQCEDYAKVEVQ